MSITSPRARSPSHGMLNVRPPGTGGANPPSLTRSESSNEVRCDLCEGAVAVITCYWCGDLRTCLPCGQKRHRQGTLKHHQLKLLLSDPPKNSNIGDPCQWCDAVASELMCPACAMVFCGNCAKVFHEVGLAFRSHSRKFQYGTDKERKPVKRPPILDTSKAPTLSTTAHEDDDDDDDDADDSIDLQSPTAGSPPGSPRPSSPRPNTSASSIALNGTPLSTAGGGGGGAGAHDHEEGIKQHAPQHEIISNVAAQATFQLANFGIGLSDSQIRDVPKDKNIKFFIVLDYAKEVISFSCKTSNLSVLSNHTRAFRSLKQAILSDTDKRHFSVYFNDSKPVAQCLAQTPAEGAQIAEALSIIARKELLGALMHVDTREHPLYSGYVFKRGKMSWGQRWMVIKRFKLELFKNKDALVALKSISLIDSRAIISPDPKKNKQFVLSGPDRKILFRLHSEAERDTVISLLENASRVDLTSPTAGGAGGGGGGGALDPKRASGRVYNSATMLSGSSSNVTLSKAARLLGDADARPQQELMVLETAQDRKQQLLAFADQLSNIHGFVPGRHGFQNVLSQLGDEAKFKIEFIEETVEAAPYEPLPRTLRYGVYRLMFLLLQSIQQGATITPVIYMPKKIWYQRQFKIQAYSQKMEGLEVLQQALLHMKKDEIDMPEFDKELLKFREVCEGVQNKLAQHLAYIHSVKQSSVAGLDKNKGIWSSIKKKVQRGVSGRDKVNDTTMYVRLLASVLELALVFEKWIQAFDTRPDITGQWSEIKTEIVRSHLDNISEFFHSVVCNIVMRDMKRVLKRYVKHCARSLEAASSVPKTK